MAPGLGPQCVHPFISNWFSNWGHRVRLDPLLPFHRRPFASLDFIYWVSRYVVPCHPGGALTLQQEELYSPQAALGRGVGGGAPSPDQQGSSVLLLHTLSQWGSSALFLPHPSQVPQVATAFSAKSRTSSRPLVSLTLSHHAHSSVSGVERQWGL